MRTFKVKTGGKSPMSGQYKPTDLKRGEITLSKGERVPPYKGKAREFKLVDPTKHTS
jgi:hypothetical protein